ncbi:serine hydrolase domain-containing protein [Paraglaciecola sp. L1A13]|uniref:serine hydrolase domain-containing protein n=1 Tax=Paraglaciecola sp. L1A13 TaxID=2686359 RepID=UPI00131EA427|nr:serine hydrolase domain-containing protein [Paraglaciecola sp. L1A13]
MSSIEIKGIWEPEFNLVVDAFKANFEPQSATPEQGAAFTLFHQGKLVVDIHAGTRNAALAPWQQDTLVNVFSTTKGIAALCIAHLVELGRLRYSDCIAAHWPEFANNGKQDITLAQVLSHQSGLNAFETPTTLDDLLDWELCCTKLAAQTPFFPPGSRTCYQALTFGFLVGEVVRRVSGLTIGEYLQQKICQTNNIDFHIGLPESQHARIADLFAPTRAPSMPKNMPSYALASMTNPVLRADFMLKSQTRCAQLPAVNGHGSANAVASLYELYSADKGLISAEILAKTTEVQSTRSDDLIGLPVHWAMGLVVNSLANTYGKEPKTFGHSGWGGSFGCHDPINRLSMGYVCNQMSPDLVGDARSQNLIKQVYACLGK